MLHAGHLARVNWRQTRNFETDQRRTKSVHKWSRSHVSVPDDLLWVVRPRYIVCVGLYSYLIVCFAKTRQYLAIFGNHEVHL